MLMDELCTSLSNMLAELPSPSIALTGGQTGRLVLEAMLKANADWPKASLFWADERAVPPDDPQSNFALANRIFLTPLHQRVPRVFRMKAEGSDLAAAAEDYTATLDSALGENGVLDLALLGVGEDGHIASLFPGHQALMTPNRRVVAVDNAPKPPSRRLSMTLSFLAQSRQIWVVATGPVRRGVCEIALGLRNQPPRQTDSPLALLLRQARNVSIFSDQGTEQTR
jgi:6-phosphogluconolactonase